MVLLLLTIALALGPSALTREVNSSTCQQSDEKIEEFGVEAID